MGLVTVYCSFITTGNGETALQAIGERMFVVDCRLNPVTLLGQVKITFVLERVIFNCGGLPVSEMENKVPKPTLPPVCAVPYKMLLDKIKPFAPVPSKLTYGPVPDVAV